MKRKGFLKTLGIIGAFGFLTISLTSCQEILDFIFSNIDLGINTYNPDDFAKTVQENGAYSKFSYEDMAVANADPITPAKGSVNILVVPVEFSDLTAYSSNNLAAIDAAFNGTKEDSTNNYWESVKSFYYKASNGILNFNFEVTDKYRPTYSSSRFVSEADDYGTESQNLLEDIYEKGLTVKGSRVNFTDSKWDSNRDGYVDGIWMIYNEKDESKVTTDRFWAYVTEYTGDIKTSRYGKYGNCALSFLYSDSLNGLDAHTLIHETGHMMGLDDYYDYNNDNNYGFTGGLDMMDLNIGEHNAFSKHALGWTKALKVDEAKTYTLKPFEESYDSLIIPSSSYNGSAFSEYLLIEFYTPTGLFKFDATSQYANKYPRFFSEKGLRIWHIDARLAYQTFRSGSTFTWGSYVNSSITKYPDPVSTSTTLTVASVAHTNSLNDRSRNMDQKPLIELASRTRTRLYGNRYATNSDLFKKGDTITSTSLSKVLDNGKFYDGTNFNYEISVDNITDEAATITINF